MQFTVKKTDNASTYDDNEYEIGKAETDENRSKAPVPAIFTEIVFDDIVPYKRALFHFLVDGSQQDALEHHLGTKFPTSLAHQMLEQRRLHFVRFTTKHASALLAHCAPHSLNHIQQIHPLERLRHVGQCHAVNKLSAVTNVLFNEVPIPSRPRTVIYADPPYRDTGLGAYRFGSEIFDYDHFYKWCMDSPFPVYISEYTMPACFETVGEFPVSVTIAPSRHPKAERKRLPKTEKLFWNRRY